MKWAVILYMFIWTGAAFAQDQDVVEDDYTSETMLHLCNGDKVDAPQDMQSMVCTFRIQGVWTMMRYNCESRRGGYDPHPSLAVGEIPSNGAARQAFKNYMAENPQDWGNYWAASLTAALSLTFPCEID